MTFRPSNTLKIGAIILVLVMLVFGIYGAIMIEPVVERLQFLAQLLSVMVAILMVYVIGIQAETMRHQTAILNRQANDVSIQSEVLQDQAKILRRQAEILELEKKPMLVFSKLFPPTRAPSVKIFITNITKYPVLIEKVEFVVKNPVRTSYEENTLETLKKLEKTVLQPSQQKELSIMVRGKIKLEVSNYYFRNIKVTYIYNITEDRVELIEERRE